MDPELVIALQFDWGYTVLRSDPDPSVTTAHEVRVGGPADTILWWEWGWGRSRTLSHPQFLIGGQNVFFSERRKTHSLKNAALDSLRRPLHPSNGWFIAEP